MPQSTRYVDFGRYRAAPQVGPATLSAERYTSADFMAREWQAVWTKAWLFAGVEEDVRWPGDYFLFEIGRESIIISRGENGRLAAVHNVCQHRGNRVLLGARGAVNQLVCPYHGWTYGLDGALRHTPDRERFPPCTDWSQRSLKPVRVETWAGLVWITMDERAPPLADFLGAIMGNLAPYHFERMRLVKHQTLILDANWKTLRDNFLEQYHVDFIHPQHATMVDCSTSENELYPFGHSSTAVKGYVTNPRYPIPTHVPDRLKARLGQLGLDWRDFDNRVGDIRAAVCAQKRILGAELGLDYGPLSDAQVTDVLQYDLFPNTFMTIKPEEVWIYGARPHPKDPDRCLFDKWTLQVPGEVAVDTKRGRNLGVDANLIRYERDERPEPEVFTREDIESGAKTLGVTIDQDVYLLPYMQAGMHSRGFSGAVLNMDEARIDHFHRWVDAWLRASPWAEAEAPA